MKNSIRLAVLILAGVLSLRMAAPVSADAPAMTPLQGNFGTVLTVSAAVAGDSYLVIWDSADYAAGTVDATSSITFTVPEAKGGAHTVVVESPTGTEILSGTFTVLPSLSLNPSSGVVGSTLTVNGKGFAAGETGIALTYDATGVETGIIADANGSWTMTMTVPISAGGAHILDATGVTTTAANVIDQAFNVTPKITADTLSGTAGTKVTVTGTGFVTSETSIRVSYDGDDAKTGITADGKGSWVAIIIVPASAKGNHVIDASGITTDAVDVPDLSFRMSSGISADKNSGNVGDPINIAGNGFGQNESGITVTFDGVAVKSNIAADSVGRWVVTITVPDAAKGAHAIHARGSLTNATDVSEVAITITTKLVIAPNGGNVGAPVSVTGSGFSGSKILTVIYGGTPVLTGITTDASGGFYATFNAPKGQHGQINMVASDAGGASAGGTFNMESTPPPVPVIVSPAAGTRSGFIGDTKVDFAWTDVSDPSGVYYDLQVSSRLDFQAILVKQTGLTVNRYISTDAEALPPGDYYWRVRAVDGAGNISDWTSPTLLKTAYASTTVFIIGVSAVILVLLLLIVFVGVMRRSRW